MPGWGCLSDQIPVTDYALQIKYQGGVIVSGEIPGRDSPYEPRPDQISDGVIFTRAVLPFKGGTPDRGNRLRSKYQGLDTPSESNTRSALLPWGEIPEYGCPIEAKY